MDWLNKEPIKAGDLKPEKIFLAEQSTSGEMYVSKYDGLVLTLPAIF